MNGRTYGSLHFQHPGDFDRRLSQQEEIQQALAVLAERPLRPPPIGDWPRITDCIPRGTGFALEAETPALHVSLRFDPSASPLGDYKIHFVSQREEETGRVLNITPIEEKDLSMHHYAMLGHFPTRYVVVTSDRQGTQRVWHVGIFAVRRTNLEDLESDE
jgi:hypothetical protein